MINKIAVGGLWERSEWEIQEHVKFATYAITLCSHCKPIDRDVNDDLQAICPAVVVAINEGGYNSTGICLDCILDAARLRGQL